MVEIVIMWGVVLVVSSLVFGGVIPLFVTCVLSAAVATWCCRRREASIDKVFSLLFWGLHGCVYLPILLWAIMSGYLMPADGTKAADAISVERIGDLVCFAAGASLFPLLWLGDLRGRAGVHKKDTG